MVDLREKTILIKNPEALSWKSFYELHFKYLPHITSFHVIVCIFFFLFMNNTFSHIRTNLFPILSFSPFPSTKHKISLSPLVRFLDPSLRLFSLSNGSWKSFLPINGPLILHEPMKIKNDFSTYGN